MAVTISNPNPIIKEVGAQRICPFCNSELKSTIDFGNRVNDISWSCPKDRSLPSNSNLDGHYNVRYVWDRDREVYTEDINIEYINVGSYHVANYYGINKSSVSTVSKAKRNIFRQGLFRRHDDGADGLGWKSESESVSEVKRAFTSDALIKIKPGMSLEDYKNKIDKLINFM